MARQQTVIITGAGFAGVTAAAALSKRGINVVILEARDRIGGRIKTVRTVNGLSYEIGASWLHDTLENRLFDKAVEHGISLYYDDSGYAYYDSQGEIPPNTRAHRVMDEIYEKSGYDYHRQGKEQELSLKDYTLDYIKNNKLLTDYQRQKAPKLARKVELLFGVSWDKLPAKYCYYPPSGRDAYVTGGFDKLFDIVFNEADKARVTVKLNTEVATIKHAEKGVTIKDTSGGTYTGDYAVVTLPSAVLKDDSRALFGENVLPAPLQNAMDKATVATLGKVFFEFERLFWRTDLDRLMVFPHHDDHTKGNDPWANPVAFVNGYNIYGRPCLVMLMTNSMTEYIERNPDKIGEYFKPLLEQLRVDKSKSLPKIKHIQVTDWTTDKYARGSYSALGIGISPAQVMDPFIEGFGRIRFAGEHTSEVGEGCAHGAYESGLREAQWIIDNAPTPAKL